MPKQIIATMPDNWERVFGSEADRKKRFKKALEEQKRRAPEEAPRKCLTGLSDDKIYRGYDRGLGRYCTGYADWKETMRKKNVDCVG